ncbi:Dolichyl-phosphate-mannose-protein mannosyltransferase [Succinivibrio dextrinosolvens]|uniref:glycosyltransferase family 39 protein n=1 Tax=Succinivibrio dextrinosolvens TaxID=83771 RepID=UPI0008E1DF3C|nr:glycosyltransferase family 39 protein [Succinivibrio dextrinosolvens]SFS83097.1 Dolichyl-phosphate-mannose-protein mannosyltransferase [Succinivibrio dextrinosolvens]
MTIIPIISIIFPGLFFCFFREKILKIDYSTFKDSFVKRLFVSLCGIVLVYLIFTAIYLFCLRKPDVIFYKFNTSALFSIRYLIYGCIISFLLIYFEKIVRLKDKYVLTINSKKTVFTYLKNKKLTILFLYTIFLAGLHFVRCFDNSFWGDEGIVITFARKEWFDMLKSVAASNHSPLHYAFAWGLVKIFGESGFIFHISSTLAYFILLIASITIIRKWFGYKTSFIFVTLCSLLPNAITYNLEVRMYTWTQLFIIASFLMVYGAIVFKQNIYYVLLTLFSVMAAYSHYFSLAPIFTFYLILLIYTVLNDRKEIKKIVLSWAIFLIIFTPWIFFTHKLRGGFVADYHIVQVPLKECIKFIFDTSSYFFLLLLFFLSLITTFVREHHFLKAHHSFNKIKNKIEISFFIENIKLQKEWYWILGGIIGVFGTIFAAQIISHLFHPIITLRYLYVSYAILWLIFAIMVSKQKYSKLFTLLLIVFVFFSCISKCINAIKVEHSYNVRLEKTLELARKEIKESDFIYTDITHFAWTICESYFPNIKHDLFGHLELGNWGLPERLTNLDTKQQYWLFLSSPISNQIEEDLKAQNLSTRLAIENGFIGTGNVWVYEVIKNQ